MIALPILNNLIMNIEYAKKLTDEERNLFFSRIKSSYNINDTSEKVIQLNYDLLIKSYNKYESEMKSEFLSIELEYKKAFFAFQNDKCICGGSLVYIKSHQFYGCKDYKKHVKHKNYKDLSEPYLRMPKYYDSYLSDIIKECDLKGKLNAKSLFEFYAGLGFDDLKFKYSGKPYSELINRYIEVNKNSKVFEKMSFERCEPLYTNVFREFGIKYKLIGEKEKYCFIDILCSNEKEVHIYECKTSEISIDFQQNNLYLNLIKFIDGNKRETQIINLCEKESTGFETIEIREKWINNGKHFGYPTCCIDSFLNKKPDGKQKKVNFNTGFTPCKKCSDKVVFSLDIESLILKRECKLPFPFHSKWYSKVYQENKPNYFLNVKI